MEPINDKDKVIESLIETIDNGEHNDVDIKLEDGMISASKLILSTRSEYFQKMFNKSSQFEEQRTSSVNFPCKRLIMQKILEHLYGGNLAVSGLTCLEIIELLNMLRLLLLEESFESVEDYLLQQLEKIVPIEECLDAVEMANSLKFESITSMILSRISYSLGILTHTPDRIVYFSPYKNIDRRGYIEKLERLSEDVVVKLMTVIFLPEIEKPYRPFHLRGRELLDTVRFFSHWLKYNNNLLTKEQEQEIIKSFDLTKFTVRNLLSEVRNTGLFSDDEIFAAVNDVHDKVRNLTLPWQGYKNVGIGLGHGGPFNGEGAI